MQSRAIKKHIRSSPRKMRLVIDKIRGKSAEQALDILSNTPNKAARAAIQVLKSAVANLNNKSREEGIVYDENEMIVKKVFADQGPTMKRIQPAPMGRAFRIRKRSNHLTIILETLDHNQEQEVVENDEVQEQEINEE